MIFSQSLRRDLNGVAGIVFSTLFAIMVTTTLTRTIGRAATDRVSSADVFPLIAFTSIGFIPLLLVLTIFLSVLVVLSRAWKDSEMVVWMASGLSLTAWMGPVLRFALPYAITVGLLSLWVVPWANGQLDDLRVRFEQRDDVAAVAPGQFRESRGANRVFFVESIGPDMTRLGNVFVAQQRDGRLTVVTSRGGHIESGPDNGRYLVLEDGRHYDGAWGGGTWTLMSFDRYGIRVGERFTQEDAIQERSADSLTLLALGTREALGELVGRISLPISALVVVLLAIPMSYVNPRLGQSMNLVSGILVYFVYTNLNALVKSWVAQGVLPFWVGVWVIHVAFVVVALWMFRRRTQVPRVTFGRLFAWLSGGRRRVRPG